MNRIVARLPSGRGITRQQLDILDALFDAGADNAMTPMRNADIADAVDDTCEATRERVVALERKGLVVSGAVGPIGGRSIVVWLTEAGAKVVRELEARGAA